MLSLQGQRSSGKIVLWLGLVVIAAGVVFGFRKLTAPPKPAIAVVYTDPVDVGLSLDGAEITLRSSPVKFEGLAPDREHTLEISKEGFTSQTLRFNVIEGQLKVLSTVALEAVKLDTGFTLDSNPKGASVLVDGKKLASPTPVRVTDLAAGKHVVRVENGFTHQPWETQIEPTRGQMIALPPVELVALSKAKAKQAERAARKQAVHEAAVAARSHAR